MVVAATPVMPNPNNDKKNPNPNPTPKTPGDKQRQPQTDKGMNKRDDKKDMDQLDDDGSPIRQQDNDFERQY